MRWMFAIVMGIFAVRSAGARAQDASLDNRLRDLLRETTVALRSAQDAQAALQAQLDTMTRQRDALMQQVAQAPKVEAVSPGLNAALVAAQSQARAAQAQLAEARGSMQHWQKAYRDTAADARDRDAAARRDGSALKSASAKLLLCTSENGKLADIGLQILHLYQTPKWNELLFANHDRLLGFARVKLENTVQDYEDKIDAQTVIAPGR